MMLTHMRLGHRGPVHYACSACSSLASLKRCAYGSRQPWQWPNNSRDDQADAVAKLAEASDNQVSGLAPSQMEEMAAAPPMSKFTFAAAEIERSQVGGDVETDGQDDDTDDQAAEAVLMNDRGDEHDRVGDAGEVGQRHNLVAGRMKARKWRPHRG